jgi:hypothetical protein
MSIDTPSVAAALVAAPIDEIEQTHWVEIAITALATTIAVLFVSLMAVVMSLA